LATQKRSIKSIWAVAALLIGGIGAWSLLDSEDEQVSSRPSDKNSTVVKPSPEKSFSIAVSVPTLVASSPSLINPPPPKIERTNEECVVNLFYSRYLASRTTPDSKFSNLRWAVEEFGMGITPESLEKAAKALSIDKVTLITMLREAAIAVFRETPTWNLNTNLAMQEYWNDQIIAHRFTGLTNEGNFDEGLAIATTQTTKDTLISNRDSFMINASKEIMPELRALLEKINTAYNHSIAEKMRRGSALDKALETIPHEQQVRLREQIAIVNRTLKTVMGNTPEALDQLGLTNELNDTMIRISQSRYLDIKISIHYSEECRHVIVEKVFKPK